MSKQSSLDYFLMKLVDMEIGKWFYANQLDDLRKAFDQSKAMHKEELEHAYFVGSCDRMNDEGSFEQYYNETYGGQNEN
jgi:hypothetical protein